MIVIRKFAWIFFVFLRIGCHSEQPDKAISTVNTTLSSSIFWNWKSAGFTYISRLRRILCILFWYIRQFCTIVLFIHSYSPINNNRQFLFLNWNWNYLHDQCFRLNSLSLKLKCFRRLTSDGLILPSKLKFTLSFQKTSFFSFEINIWNPMKRI